jgi:L-threonylcarbamoyladenylate synthase
LATRVITVDPDHPRRDDLREAAAVLRDGGLVAFPTETVYGLGANALDHAAVARIFRAKGRPATDPVIVHLSDPGQLVQIARDVPDNAYKLAAAFWPGPLTLILNKTHAVPLAVTAGLDTVGVRIPSHAVARILIGEAAVPVAAPSANLFSRPSPTRAEHVLADLENRIDIVVDGGPTPIGVESTIVDLTVSPAIIRRPGGITLEQLANVLPGVTPLQTLLTPEKVQQSPGQLLRHYAPSARLTTYVGETSAIAETLGAEIRSAVAAGLRVGVVAPEEDLRALAPRLAAVGATGRVVTSRCGSRMDLAAIARDLFGALRSVDAEGVDVIFASAPDAGGIAAAIIDRLTRASEGRLSRIR